MIKNTLALMLIAAFYISLSSCGGKGKKVNSTDSTKKDTSAMQKKLEQFATVELKTDLSKLTEKEKKMIPILINIAKIMDDISGCKLMVTKIHCLQVLRMKQQNICRDQLWAMGKA